ncbi:myosin-9-like isoform X1 [Solanum pennellii]|uniref:Myosin-9-like isoform X1 n=1 Tax=Solanum pennellii TaxID=28526 RepID=A0ABM1HLV9_SOLPN|nr:myosin-9-like isoform X1 [Solanum pennellii]
MSWLRSAVSKAVEVGGAGNRNISRNLRYYADSVVQQASNAVSGGAKLFLDRSGSRSFQNFKQAVKTLEELSVSCRGIERVQLLRRWLVALKEIERLSLPLPVSEHVSSPKSIDSIYTTDDDRNSPREPILVLYYDPDLGGEPMNFRDVFLSSQALEGMILSMILEAPDTEEVSLLMEIFGLSLTGGKEVREATMSSIKVLAKVFSSYKEEVLAKKEELLLHAQGAIAGLKINADIMRIDSEVSNIHQKLDKVILQLPSSKHEKEPSSVATSEALKEALSQLQFLSKMEALLLQKKALLGRDGPESQTKRVFKLKVLSESLSSSTTKTEARISENRIQKEGALKFRVTKTSEISQLEKELMDEINVLENQRDELEAALQKVKVSLVSANARLYNAREERDQFDEANNQILQHFKVKEDELSKSMILYRAEADVCDAFISFLEDSWTFESSHIKQKQKQVNDELDKCEDYLVNLAIHVLSMYKDELGPSIANLRQLGENLKRPEIINNEKIETVEVKRRLEEEYMDAEAKLVTVFSVVDGIKRQFYGQDGTISRKGDEKMKELLDTLQKLEDDFESINRPTLELETLGKTDAKSKETLEGSPSSSPTQPTNDDSASFVDALPRIQTPRPDHTSNPETVVLTPRRWMRENVRRSLSLAINQTTGTLESSFKSPKHRKGKSMDPAAELSRLKLELELENDSRIHPSEEINDWCD